MGASYCVATNSQVQIVEHPKKRSHTQTLISQQIEHQLSGLPLHQYYGDNCDEFEDKIAVHLRSRAKNK